MQYHKSNISFQNLLKSCHLPKLDEWSIMVLLHNDQIVFQKNVSSYLRYWYLSLFNITVLYLLDVKRVIYKFAFAANEICINSLYSRC